MPIDFPENNFAVSAALRPKDVQKKDKDIISAKARKKIIFLNGRMVPASESFIKKLSPGKLSGRGAFETLRAYSGEIFLLEKHLARLFRGINKLNIRLPYSRKQIAGWVRATLRQNRLKNARVRVTVWKEKKRPAVSVVVLPYKPYSVRQYEKGFAAHISGVRLNEASQFANIKSIDRRLLVKASREAEHQKCDEAILLNRKKELAEGTRTNIFFVKNKILLTPSLKCGGLEGITRQIVLRLAREKGIKTKRVAAGPRDLLDCDEAFLTNSLIEIMPLTVLNGRRINKGKPGPVTQGLLKCYRKLTPKSSCPGRGNLL